MDQSSPRRMNFDHHQLHRTMLAGPDPARDHVLASNTLIVIKHAARLSPRTGIAEDFAQRGDEIGLLIGLAQNLELLAVQFVAVHKLLRVS